MVSESAVVLQQGVRSLALDGELGEVELVAWGATSVGGSAA